VSDLSDVGVYFCKLLIGSLRPTASLKSSLMTSLTPSRTPSPAVLPVRVLRMTWSPRPWSVSGSGCCP